MILSLRNVQVKGIKPATSLGIAGTFIGDKVGSV